jgi:DNA helicase-2/ATP-dependent DNA helicase PcrA
VYERALDDAGVAFQVRGGERFFTRPEVRQAMVTLRSASGAGPRDGSLVDSVRAVLVPLGLTEEPAAGTAGRQRWESLRALVGLAEELSAVEEDADLGRFAAELATRADASHPPTVQGVTLASLHAAKGLEWDSVFLVGLVDGTLPIQHADGDDAKIEEERRLLYVGVTRARRQLSLTWALSRSSGGRRNRRRSRFLYGLIPDDHVAARTPGGKGASKARCRVCGSPLIGVDALKMRRCSGCPSDVDIELLDRLKSWRSATAKQQKVPTYVVFTDATLTAIAEHRPADVAALVDIPGIGAGKLDRYGPDVLALVAAPPD